MAMRISCLETGGDPQRLIELVNPHASDRGLTLKTLRSQGPSLKDRLPVELVTARDEEA